MANLSSNKPQDFDAYWGATLEELSQHPPAPEIEADPMRATDYCEAWRVHLTSIGPYRIFAYLSKPRGNGPFPARLYVPRYGSTVEPVPQGDTATIREHYVVCSVGVRGQRGSDMPYAASFPGLLTEGIDDAARYIYRGIVADCCRGLEYLASLPEVDSNKIVVMGNDLALMTAAMGHRASCVVSIPILFYATGDLAPAATTYPLDEINDYVRCYPERSETVRRTLSYFDLRWFAEMVNVPTLIRGEADGGLLDGQALEPLLDSMSTAGHLHRSERSQYKDGVFTEQWVAQQVGMDHLALPEHWR